MSSTRIVAEKKEQNRCVWPENAKCSIWSVFLLWLANHATPKINTFYIQLLAGWLAGCLLASTSPIHQFIFHRSGSQSLASIITEIKISWQGDKSFVVTEIIICVLFVRSRVRWSVWIRARQRTGARARLAANADRTNEQIKCVDITSRHTYSNHDEHRTRRIVPDHTMQTRRKWLICSHWLCIKIL